MLKYHERKTSPFIIYADFESILVPEDNENQNKGETYTNKYQTKTCCFMLWL